MTSRNLEYYGLWAISGTEFGGYDLEVANDDHGTCTVFQIWYKNVQRKKSSNTCL